MSWFLLCFGEPALAGQKDAEVEAAVDQAVAGWAPTLNCYVLEPEGFKRLLDFWNGDREKTVALMVDAKIDETAIKRMSAKTAADSMMSNTKGSAAELIAYCNSHPDWNANFSRFKNLPLSGQVEKALNPQ